MIRTVSGDFPSDSPFQERPWTWGDENIDAFRSKVDDTVIIQGNKRAIVQMDGLTNQYIPPVTTTAGPTTTLPPVTTTAPPTTTPPPTTTTPPPTTTTTTTTTVAPTTTTPAPTTTTAAPTTTTPAPTTTTPAPTTTTPAPTTTTPAPPGPSILLLESDLSTLLENGAIILLENSP